MELATGGAVTVFHKLGAEVGVEVPRRRRRSPKPPPTPLEPGDATVPAVRGGATTAIRPNSIPGSPFSHHRSWPAPGGGAVRALPLGEVKEDHRGESGDLYALLVPLHDPLE